MIAVLARGGRGRSGCRERYIGQSRRRARRAGAWRSRQASGRRRRNLTQRLHRLGGRQPRVRVDLIERPACSPRRWRAGWRSEAGLDLAAVSGSGPHGRIVRRDIEAPRPVPAAKPTAAAPAPRPVAQLPAPVPASDAAIRAMYPPGSFEEIPHDTMRKVIARRLTEAKTTIPHFYLTMDIELDALLALRATINAHAPKEPDGEPPSSSRSTTSSSRRWRWRCCAYPTPTSPGPRGRCCATGRSMSGWRWRSPAG